MDATLSSSSRGNDRPNVVPGVDVTPGPRTPNEWFNIQTFAIQPQYTFGNAGRNIVTGVPVFSIDFSAKKSFFVSERKYLQFRFEAFNFLNHANFGDPP